MRLTEVKVMRGPNYWAPECHKVIVLKVETESGNEPGLTEKALAFAKEQIEQCAPDCLVVPAMNGTENSWASLLAQVAILFQQAAGIPVHCTRVKQLLETKWAIAFEYETEDAGILAGEKAVGFLQAVLQDTAFDLTGTIQELKEINTGAAPGPSTQSIISEAAARHIPWKKDASLVRLGYGCAQKFFQATVVETTGNIAVELAADKVETKNLLADNGIPVPYGIEIETEEELMEAVREIGMPVVVKPLDGNYGRGITADPDNTERLKKAFAEAKKVSDALIVERQVTGEDYRLLVVDYKFVAAARRTPPFIVGDGHSTIRELTNRLNLDPERGKGHEKNLTLVEIDAHTVSLLEELQLTEHSVLPVGEKLFLKRTANLSSGGTAEDVTMIAHPAVSSMAERIARLMRLDVCGIDLIAEDIAVPVNETNGAVIEVNAGPGFRMHTHPSKGMPRNVAKPVVDMLFPGNSDGRIPLVAVTGTNGKTTVVRLIAHIAGACNTTGFTTTEGIYLNGELIVEGDCSGPKSAAVVLNDPAVEFAVLECARGGILRSGLAFDQCSVSIVTNVTEDHLGIDDIYTLAEYAQVKEVVPISTLPGGTAVLNADDELVYAMREKVSCAVILFSMDPDSERIRKHCEKGGRAVVVRNGEFILKSTDAEKPVIAITDVPITANGTATFMVKNVLAAIGGAIASGFSFTTIAESLRQFHASPDTTPGRMNLFSVGGVKLMLDYVHNAGGYTEISEYMKNVPAARKIGIIAATGDRKKDDIVRIGKYAAGIFTEIIIRHDTDSRGSDNDELTALLKEGISGVNPAMPVTVISDEEQALRHAVSSADAETFVFAAADKVFRSIGIIKKLEQEFENKAVA